MTQGMGVVGFTLAATLCIQIGYFLWKASADSQPRIGSLPLWQTVVLMLRDWRWCGGLIATIAGWLLFLEATRLGEISLIQPLMSTGDLLLVAMAVIFLGERLGRREWIGVLVTVIGAAGLALGGENRPGKPWDVGALTAGVVLALGAVVALVLLARARRRPELPLALAVGLCFGTGAALTEAWATATDTLGWRAFLHPLLAVVVAANVVGLGLLQTAFQQGRAAVIVPIQLAMGNALAMALGAWVFDEHVPGLRLASAALVMLGAAMLHRGQEHAEPTPGEMAPGDGRP